MYEGSIMCRFIIIFVSFLIASSGLAKAEPIDLCSGYFDIKNNDLARKPVDANNPYLIYLFNEAFKQYPFEVSEQLNQLSKNCEEKNLPPSEILDDLVDQTNEFDQAVNQRYVPHNISSVLTEFSHDYYVNKCPVFILIDNDHLLSFPGHAPIAMHIDAKLFEIEKFQVSSETWYNTFGKCKSDVPFQVGPLTFNDVIEYRNYLAEKASILVSRFYDQGFSFDETQKALLPDQFKQTLPIAIDDNPVNRFCYEETSNRDDCKEIEASISQIYQTTELLNDVCPSLDFKAMSIANNLLYGKMFKLIQVSLGAPDNIFDEMKDKAWNQAIESWRDTFAFELLSLRAESEGFRLNFCYETYPAQNSIAKIQIEKLSKMIEDEWSELSAVQKSLYEKIRPPKKKRSF